jgi:hypothetical protein
VVTVEAEFIPDVQPDQQTASQPDSEAEEIYKTETFIPH